MSPASQTSDLRPPGSFRLTRSNLYERVIWYWKVVYNAPYGRQKVIVFMTDDFEEAQQRFNTLNVH